MKPASMACWWSIIRRRSAVSFAATVKAGRARSDLPAGADFVGRSALPRWRALAAGYVYYVSLRGVTGSAHLDADAVAAQFPRLRAQLKLPIGVGFGIRDAASAKAVSQVADAVVIGSALVQLVERSGADNAPLALQHFLAEIRSALDAKEVAP